MYADLLNFLHVVEQGTFTAAARAAHLTQPALSASIRRLEEPLGGPLFLRDRRGALLTDAGRALLPHARAARAAVDEGRAAVAEVLGLAKGEVTLGAGATATTYLLPRVLGAFLRRHPGVRYRLREIGTPGVVEAVREGSLDLGIATRLPGDTEPWGVVEEPWCADPLVVVASPDERRDDPPYLTFVEGSPLRILLERHFPEARVAMELGSIPAIKGNVAAGLGVALVPRSAAERTVAEGRLMWWPDPRVPLTRDLVLIHRGVDRLSTAAAALRGLLVEEAGRGPLG
ncbi:MAG: LysR family transcriptional regulator [Myxococcales bacterium]|nr:LysR family transcriptional regulator [Myxococcales bacterium]MCB9668578.1 LysR family transcriptional regulator [Alphaproteobacteria bacterium]MCB9690818.1 LysR family transcriptional regulator [Alphaproteobacteria bacterium]